VPPSQRTRSRTVPAGTASPFIISSAGAVAMMAPEPALKAAALGPLEDPPRPQPSTLPPLEPAEPYPVLLKMADTPPLPPIVVVPKPSPGEPGLPRHSQSRLSPLRRPQRGRQQCSCSAPPPSSPSRLQPQGSLIFISSGIGAIRSAFVDFCRSIDWSGGMGKAVRARGRFRRRSLVSRWAVWRGLACQADRVFGRRDTGRDAGGRWRWH
jgi:hypothetical protein